MEFLGKRYSICKGLDLKKGMIFYFFRKCVEFEQFRLGKGWDFGKVFDISRVVEIYS